MNNYMQTTILQNLSMKSQLRMLKFTNLSINLIIKTFPT